MMASCGISPERNCIKGVVADATMNTVAVTVGDEDTLNFGLARADKADLQGLLIGDSVEIEFVGKYEAGMDAERIVMIAENAEDEFMRLFRKGIRMEAVVADTCPVYALFSRDSITVELVFTSDGTRELLERRNLPSGGHVWNVEDDDTKNLLYEDGCWTVSQRGKVLCRQLQSDNDDGLGAWELSCYEGTFLAESGQSINYQLFLRNKEHSGDGYFLLRSTYVDVEGENGVTYLGRRYTQRGVPKDDNATVWQLKTDDGKDIFNFLYDADKHSLVLLNDDFELDDSGTNCVLKKKVSI